MHQITGDSRDDVVADLAFSGRLARKSWRLLG
jgi:hypothetical protein